MTKVKKSVLARSLAATQDWKCCYCAFSMTSSSIRVSNLDSAVTVEHVLPRSEGGSNHPSNLKAACKLCNNLRQSASHEVFAVVIAELAADVRWSPIWHDLEPFQRKELAQEVREKMRMFTQELCM